MVSPGGPAYTTALNALYSVAYALKFTCKAEGRDFIFISLEGLWWWDDLDITDIAHAPPRDEWNWKSLIRQPDFVTKEMVEAVKRDVKEKKGIEEVERIVLEAFNEGLSAQVMHIGPYSEEASTIQTLHKFIEEKGYAMRGLHLEIYMSDPRRVPQERLKIIIRQPIEIL